MGIAPIIISRLVSGGVYDTICPAILSYYHYYYLFEYLIRPVQLTKQEVLSLSINPTRCDAATGVYFAKKSRLSKAFCG